MTDAELPSVGTQDSGAASYGSSGWAILPVTETRQDWVAAALPYARAALKDPEFSNMYQCEDTWFVGLDALPNDFAGRLPEGPSLAEAATDVTALTGPLPDLHKAQLSVIFEGYPRPRSGETEAGFRYRQRRDAAHVDGVLAIGAARRRMVQEPHAFILGLPLNTASRDAGPLVVWEGSHRWMQAAFREAFHGKPAADLGRVDVTEIYQSTRKTVFEKCPRRILHAPPGSAILLHRLVLHGVAPWQAAASALPEGRMVAYFRPPMPGGVAAWYAET